MIQVITFILLFVLPFLILPFGTTAFENPKVLVAEAGVLLIFLIALLKSKIRPHENKAQMVIYGIIIIISLIHLLFFRTNISFFGNSFRMQGIFLLWILLLFSYLTTDINFNKIRWWSFPLLLILQIILIFYLPLNESQRYVGTLGEPNALGAYAVFVWPYGWILVKDKKIFSIFIKAILIISVSVILYLSGSRSGLIGFVIQIMFLILLRKYQFKKAAVICLIAILVSYIFPFFQNNVYENRIEVWKSAIAAGAVNPLIGNGFGNTEIALHKAAHSKGLPIQYYYFDSSHNLFFDWWVQAGIFGILSISAIVFFAFKNFIFREKKLEFILIIGLISCFSFNPANVTGLLAFWFLAGKGFEKVSISTR